MALDTKGLTLQLQSHALTTGIFDRVNTHEPPSAPGSGVTCALWFSRMSPIPAASGLNSTTGRVEFQARIMMSGNAEPRDDIDPKLLQATDLYVAQLSGDFDLGSTVRNVDLLGMHGDPLQAVAGYLNQDNKFFRVILVTIPLIVNDVWTQVA